MPPISGLSDVYRIQRHQRLGKCPAVKGSARFLDGGFYLSDKVVTTDQGSVLVVLYSKDFAGTLENVKSAGGEIVRDIFSFPAGRRFHFSDPGGNEYAVWSE